MVGRRGVHVIYLEERRSSDQRRPQARALPSSSLVHAAALGLQRALGRHTQTTSAGSFPPPLPPSPPLRTRGTHASPAPQAQASPGSCCA